MLISLNVNEAKAHLSKYLHAVEAGETVALCRRNVQVAGIRALPVKATLGPRPMGLASDRGVPLPAGFFDDLPEEIVAAFSGADE